MAGSEFEVAIRRGHDELEQMVAKAKRDGSDVGELLFGEQAQRWAITRADKAGIARPHPEARVLRVTDHVRTSGQVDVGTAGQGAELVFTGPGTRTIADLTRERSAALRAGARLFPVAGPGSLSFPSAASADITFSAEVPGAPVTATNPVTSGPTATPHSATVTTFASRQVLRQSSWAGDFIGEMQARAVARAIDVAAFGGTGTGGQPLGLLNHTGITLDALGTNGAIPTHADVLRWEKLLIDQRSDAGGAAVVTSSTLAAKLKATERASGSDFVWEGSAANGVMAGLRAIAASTVPADLTKGTSTTVCSGVVVGDFRDLLIPIWPLVVLVDEWSKAEYGLVVITTQIMLDIVALRPASFVRVVDALSA